MATNSKSVIYYLVAIKTCARTSGGAYSKNRANPLPGQGFDPSVFVECSRTIRDQYPTGTVFLVWATLTSREGGKPFLYSHHSWKFFRIEERLAKQWIAEGKIGKGRMFATREEIRAVGFDL